MLRTLAPRVEHVMGTAIGITVDGPTDAVEEAVAWLRWVDDTFSTYKPDSQISRIGRGELAVEDASPEVRHVLAWCADIEHETNGRFHIRPGLPEMPPLDPSGLVKGWSIDEAGMILRLGGIENFMINAGGDVLCSGHPPTEPSWPIGVLHPLDPESVAAVVSLGRGAIATSGTYERGEHIWGRRGTRLLSVSVVGPDLATSDALATAAFADPDDLTWMANYPGYDLLLIGADHRVRWTPGLDDRISLTPDEAA